jgi:very-short-patch-repair endonuclease
VTVLLPSRARPPRVGVHETERLGRSEAASRDGIRVTTPMRTLADLADVLDAKPLELTLDRFLRRGLVHPSRLRTYLEDDWCRRRRGTVVLRKLVAERLGQRPSGSEIETLMLQLIRDAGLPLPVGQHPVKTPFGVRYLDLAYPDKKIAIELDGMDSRLDRDVFLDERVRQNLIEAQGWAFRRFGEAHVTEHRLWCAFTLGEALELRPVRWA